MNKNAFGKIHVVVNILSFGMLCVYLAYMLIVYKDFPEQIGIHYGKDNEFDVYASRTYAFFPFIAGFGLAIVFTVGSLAINRAKQISRKLSAEDSIFVRETVLIALDSMKLFWAVFYTIWAHCIIHQTRMFTFGLPIREFQTLPLLIIIGAFLAADSKVRLKKTKKYIITAEIILVVVIIFVRIIRNNF